MRISLTTIVVISIMFFICSLNAYSAPLFGDLPDTFWATDAVAGLASKGLVEGYPDGTFKGDRAATRWEMAMVIARLLAKNDQEHETFASKEDMQQVKHLANSYLAELEAFGVRISSLEKEYQKLNIRTTELERIKFYGGFESVWVSQRCQGPLPMVGSTLVPGIDWSNGRLITTGSAISATAKFGADAKISEDFNGGTEFAAYTNIGPDSINQYWGTIPPYLSNPFLASGTPANLTGIQGLNNIPWARMTLNNLWLNHNPSNTKVVCGSFTPDLIEKTILAGPKNPNIHNPMFLPFYGAKVSSYKKDRLISWETSFATIPQDSGTSFNYNTWMASANMAFNFKRGKISLNYLRTLNEMNSFLTEQNVGIMQMPISQRAGIIPIPLGRNWIDTRTNTLRNAAGPQSQNSYGITLHYNLSKALKVEAEAAGTNYNPDTSGTNYSATTCGNLARIGLLGNFNNRLKLKLDYISVSPTYDPFLLRYQTPPNLPIILPYGTYYSNYWQLHDSQTYPSNRQGLVFSGSYNWANSMLTANWSKQDQVAASTREQMQSIGNIEPLFTTIQGTGSEKGTVTSYGLGFSHTFRNNLSTFVNYFKYDIIRASVNPLDSISFNENIYIGGLSYPIGRKLTLYANYTIFNLEGNSGRFQQNFNQQIPALGAGYSLSEKSYIKMSYRLFNLRNYALQNSDWNGNQAIMEYSVNF